MARQKRQPCPQTDALAEKLGQTILRLRTADKMSLGDLSEISGVAKSMISQIEKNETNPSLATLSRLSQALGTSVEAMVSQGNGSSALVQKTGIQDTPLLKSEDGLCELRIIGTPNGAKLLFLNLAHPAFGEKDEDIDAVLVKEGIANRSACIT